MITIINNSVIASPGAVFRLEVGDNPILGSGSIRLDPIPAPFNFICAKGTPTLSQWGLITLALSMVIVGILGIRQKSRSLD